MKNIILRRLRKRFATVFSPAISLSRRLFLKSELSDFKNFEEFLAYAKKHGIDSEPHLGFPNAYWGGKPITEFRFNNVVATERNPIFKPRLTSFKSFRDFLDYAVKHGIHISKPLGYPVVHWKNRFICEGIFEIETKVKNPIWPKRYYETSDAIGQVIDSKRWLYDMYLIILQTKGIAAADRYNWGRSRWESHPGPDWWAMDAELIKKRGSRPAVD